jgi:LysR family transcriptional regulator, glycine cleavage system transcriptional activator
MKNLPPLNPLRAFEAAARHSSVRLAADEMNVTPGAVSRQVRVLEDHLGVVLFRRSPSEITLTAEGEQYFKAISPLLWGLSDATVNLTGRKGVQIVHIRAYTTFAGKWLIPRLSRFADAHPNIELRLTTSLDAVDFQRENVDAAIRLGDGDYPQYEVDKLIENHLAPLCTPEYAEREQIRVAQDLEGKRLLHTLARPDDWRIWIETVGLQGRLDWHLGPKYASSILAYQAALEHQGLMMAQKALFEEDLRQGRLIQPVGPTVTRGKFTYYLILPRNRMRNPAMRRFREWLQNECEALQNDEPVIPTAPRHSGMTK